MSNFDLISKLFHEHIKYLSLSADTIVDVSENIASQIATAILSERKVFSVGIGLDAAPASAFYHLIRDGLGPERPTLPIIRMTAEQADPIDSAS
jgi:phosphoheptose isomerase